MRYTLLTRSLVLSAICLAGAASLEAQSRKKTKSEAAPPPVTSATSAPARFAPVPADHALASIWNDPEFARRLIGSYGFHSDLEPRMSAEEQTVYKEKIVPLLRDDPNKALAELNALIKPGSSAVLDYTAATIHFQNERLPEAIKFYEQAHAKHSDFLRAQKNLAFALVRAGRHEEAIPQLARTVTLGGADGKIFGLLGYAYLSQEKFVSAEAAYKQAMLFEPDNLDFKLGLVKSLIAQANYDPALALLDELLQNHSERAELWGLQANVFVQKEQPKKAALNLEFLRKLGKATAQHLNLLGDIYVAQENTDLALVAYKEALEKEPGKNTARALKAAEILVNRGAWEEAKQLLETVRTASGAELAGADEIKLLKLRARVELAQGHAQEAIQVIEGLLEKNPTDGEALLLAGDYYARHEQPEKAEFRYESAARITGFEPDAYVKHAQLLVQTQKYDRAIELLRKAQKIKPRENVQRYLEKLEQVALTSAARS